MMRSRRFHILLLALGMILGCGTKTGKSDLGALVPGLSEDMASHLSHGSKADFREYARTVGLEAVSQAYMQILLSLPTDSVRVFEQKENRLGPELDKLADVLGNEFRLAPVQARQRAYDGYPAHDRLEILRLIKEQRALILNSDGPVESRARSCLALIERSRPYADAIDIANLYAFHVSLLPKLNQYERTPEYLQLAIDMATQNGDFVLASQFYGSLGSFFWQAGDADRMKASWNRGMDLARQVGSWQEARILVFYSAFYLNEGHFALSREMMRRAQDRCRELGESRVEIRFLVEGVMVASNFGGWTAIGRDLERADVLLREGDKAWGPAEKAHWKLRVKRCQAQYLSAIGSCEQAESLSAQIMEESSAQPPSSNMVASQLDAVGALRSCGKLRQAMQILDNRDDFAHEHGTPTMREDWDLEAAEINFALGNHDACRKRLEAVRNKRRQERDEANRAWLRSDLLSVRLAIVDGNPTRARRILIKSLRLLSSIRKDLDLSPDASLALPVACEIEDLAHELLDASAEMGYAREMAWRTPQRNSPPHVDGDSNQDLVRSAKNALSRLAPQKAAHCVYRVENDRTVRWTAYGGKVERDELPISLPELRDRVSAFRKTLAQGSALTDSLAREAYDLATFLLPAFVLAQSGPKRLFVTTDGPLNQLPFETLSASAMGYAPLLEYRDMAYVLFDQMTYSHPGQRAVIVSDPNYSPELKQRYSILTEALPAGIHEAATFAELFPNVASLRGTEATKAELLKSWGGAEAIYFACHTIQNPEIPYISFIPLASASTGQKEDAYLDLVDVRSADLSRCQLVVLSSCGSGASYLSGRLSAPSLAEAFLQAGARAVISTSWNVKDDDGARVMRLFSSEYASAKDPVVALDVARRQLLEQGTPPQIWASYSVALGSF